MYFQKCEIIPHDTRNKKLLLSSEKSCFVEKMHSGSVLYSVSLIEFGHKNEGHVTDLTATSLNITQQQFGIKHIYPAKVHTVDYKINMCDDIFDYCIIHFSSFTNYCVTQRKDLF